MKITITQPGWSGYTGFLGMVEFADGISVEEVSRADAAQLAGIVSVEEVGTGKNPSAAQIIVDSVDNAAPVESTAGEASVAPAVAALHSKALLEKIADASGIKGIREIADPLGIKGNSISELIEKVLLAQAG